MRAHQADIWRFLRALGCDAAQADDLSQETFLGLLKAEFEERDAASTLAWLRKAARNLFLTNVRQGRVRAALNLDDVEEQWAKFAGDDGAQSKLDALRACMQGLDDRQREALQLRYGAESTRAELAKRLKLSEGGTKNLLERVKEKLRECIERRLGHAL
ncbi:MAG: RNA polymerase sigma factor [Planctomycetes bacterium]|nr:RNA polymerase sigma factor [Planctomycetota bacterium]